MVFAFSSHGQILKIHRTNIDTDSSHYFLGDIGLSFNLNNQSATAEKQITYRGLTTYTDFAYVGDKNAFLLITNLNYFKATDGPLVSNGYAHVRVNYLRKRSLSYETYVQVQYDNGRNMILRMLGGGGARIRLAKFGQNRLRLGLGIMQEHEIWQPFDEDGTIEKNITKLASYLGGKIQLTKDIDLQMVVFYQAGYDAPSACFRQRISGDLEIATRIIGRLDFIFSAILQYENRPIIPISNYSYTVSNGLKWTF